ncbi:hypothetical protein BV898_01406 [Hypsibius exemplaris]|uniref:Uncharacterized protein n=1 Tax=Hypsibius exemplaris TaxID=2072580 RepID=A0A1W0XBC7_HYPEX|nr:hypothetical protein BV898_01406 [Hypsibius exemplaris]
MTPQQEAKFNKYAEQVARKRAYGLSTGHSGGPQIEMLFPLWALVHDKSKCDFSCDFEPFPIIMDRFRTGPILKSYITTLSGSVTDNEMRDMCLKARMRRVIVSAHDKRATTIAQYCAATILRTAQFVNPFVFVKIDNFRLLIALPLPTVGLTLDIYRLVE